MAWQPHQVEEMVLTAFWRRGGNVASPVDVDHALGYRRRFPELAADDWSCLLQRSHCIASKISIAERRRALGIKARTFEDRWRRATRVIAEGLNGEARNRATFAANEDAEDRLVRSKPHQAPSILLQTASDRRWPGEGSQRTPGA